MAVFWMTVPVKGELNGKVEAPVPDFTEAPSSRNRSSAARRLDDAFSSSDLARRNSRCGMISSALSDSARLKSDCATRWLDSACCSADWASPMARLSRTASD